MISLHIGLGDGLYNVSPTKDITTEESAWLAIFCTVLSHNYNPSTENRLKFIEEHNLARHFIKIAEEYN